MTCKSTVGTPIIALVGPLPPPYGGYTTYVKLLSESLLSHKFGYYIIDEAHPDFGNGILRTLQMGKAAIRDLLLYRDLLKKREIKIAHFVSQYNWRRFLMHSFLFRKIVKNGWKQIFDIRAGAFIQFCENSSYTRLKLIQSIMSKATAVTVEGQIYVDYIQQKFGVKAVYMPNFVSWAETGDKYEATQTLNIPLVVVFCGRLTIEKGVYDLVEAVGRICHDIPVRLDLIGPASQEVSSNIKRIANHYQANDSIRFLGPKRKNELLALASQGHVFALPTRHKSEGHPNALTEAMALGLSVIACDQGFIKDVLGGTGLIVKSNSPDDIAKSILHLFNNPHLRQKLGSKARDRAKTHFSDLAIIPKWAHIYNRVIDSDKS